MAREAKAEKDFLKAYFNVLKNRPFVIVLFGYALNLIGLTFLQTSIPYYFNYVYKDWPGISNAEALQTYAGIGVGFGYVAPYAMVPDTIEVDAARTGKRNEGAFYGMYLYMSKIGQAVAWQVGLLVLSLGHYVANAAQAESAKLAIRLLVGPLPAVVLLGALVLVQFYPLDEKTYEAIMAKAAEPEGR